MLLDMRAAVKSADPDAPLPKGFDPDQLRRALRHLMDPAAGLTELRILGARFVTSTLIQVDNRYGGIMAGWYDQPEALVADAHKLREVSGYLCLNPADPQLKARSHNKLKPRIKNVTADVDVAMLRWLFVDIDSVRPKDVSATAAQRAAAHERTRQILADHPALAGAALSGSSGNGGYIFARLPDYPNDEEHRTLLAQVNASLAGRYTDERAKVDPATKNAARIGPLVGTLKCKGEHIKGEQEYTLVTLESVGGLPLPADAADEPTLVPFDAVAWLAAHPAPPKPGRGRPASSPRGDVMPVGAGASPVGGHELERRIGRARAYVAAMPPAVSGQGGHGQTFGVACALVKGFDLSIEDARPIIDEYNLRCEPPWDAYQLHHKLVDADEKADDKPRGYLLEGGGAAEQSPTPGDTPYVPEGAEANPARLAQRYIMENYHNYDCYNCRDGMSLRTYQGDTYAWSPEAACYRRVLDSDLRASVTHHCEADFEGQHRAAMIEHAAAERSGESSGRRPRLRDVTRGLVADVIQAIAARATIPVDRMPSVPAWVDGDGPWPADETIATRNGLVHLPALARGEAVLLPPTPGFFCCSALDFEFRPGPPEPVEFLRLVGSMFSGDPEQVALLQEVLGDLLAKTQHQKIVMLIGPPGSGKGTLLRVMQELVGPGNHCSPSFSSLATHFGVEPVIGKRLATFADARAGRDTAAFVERLLSISGKDSQTIDRKNKSAFIGHLDVRFVIATNVLPQLREESGAFGRRLMYLRTVTSHAGREDITLFDRLRPELPGILTWAARGWARLRETGRFTLPESTRSTAREMAELSSPIGTFVAECCVVDPSAEATRDELYRAWVRWCEQRGYREPGNETSFGIRLAAAAPTVTSAQRRCGNARWRCHQGIALRPVASPYGSDEPPTF